jgi:hypothetical protein
LLSTMISSVRFPSEDANANYEYGELVSIMPMTQRAIVLVRERYGTKTIQVNVALEDLEVCECRDCRRMFSGWVGYYQAKCVDCNPYDVSTI